MKPFHPEELALLAAIHAEPREDTPRLVYADWLQEHGESERAEFIRLQCATANPGEPTYKYTPRERSLIRRFGTRWRGQRLLAASFLNCFPSQPKFQLHGYAAFIFQGFHRGLPDVMHIAHHDERGILNMDAVVEAIPPHYQLCLLCVFHSNYFGGYERLLRHPVIARAQRILFGARNPRGPIPIPHSMILEIVKTLRTRKMLYVRFGALTTESKQLVDEQLSPHIPILVVSSQK